MAQADLSVAINLQKAILNISKYPRGDIRPSDYMKYTTKDYQTEDHLFRNIAKVAKLSNKNIFLPIINSRYESETLFQLDDILLSGSITEGTFLFSLDNETSSDIDFMIVVRHIKITEEDQKKGNLVVKENTPFVSLYLTDEDLIETCVDCLHETSSNTSWEKRAKLSSMKLKMQFKEKYSFSEFFMPNKKDDLKTVEDIPSLALSAKFSFPMWRHAPVRNFDFVLAIKCEGWPLCAQEWIFRPRCWPSQDLVQTIVKEGFHIVCKSSPKGDFRLSYSSAETLLIADLSDLQFKTYRAFKSFVSHYKKNWSLNAKKAVCSYYLKTIVLWYCEKSDPIDWTEDRIVGHLLSLIDDLIFALNEKNLSMYFMPKYNLMERFEDTTEAVKQMTELRLNINLITKAIITEQRNAVDVINHAHAIHDKMIMYFKETIRKEHFKPSDFFEFFHHLEKFSDEVSTIAAQKLLNRKDIKETIKENYRLLIRTAQEHISEEETDIWNVLQQVDSGCLMQ